MLNTAKRIRDKDGDVWFLDEDSKGAILFV